MFWNSGIFWNIVWQLMTERFFSRVHLRNHLRSHTKPHFKGLTFFYLQPRRRRMWKHNLPCATPSWKKAILNHIKATVRIFFLAVFPPEFLMPASSQCMDKPENSESKKDNLFNCVPNISFWFYFQFLSWKESANLECRIGTNLKARYLVRQMFGWLYA